MSHADAVLTPRFAAPDLIAGFTTRAFSPDTESLDAARQRLATATGLPVASVGQVHEARIAVVREPGHVDAHDGLVSDQAGLLLSVVAADCGIVLLADAEAGIVGACHSGWRGTVAGIVGATVEAMAALGADPARIEAYIGPCISTDAFEVGEEVAAQFPASEVVRKPEWPRPHVDLQAALRRQLAAAGVTSIEADASCTVGDPRFYSYRGEGGTKGRMLGFIGRR